MRQTSLILASILVAALFSGCKQSFLRADGSPAPAIWLYRLSYRGNQEVLRCIDQTPPGGDLKAKCVRAY